MELKEIEIKLATIHERYIFDGEYVLSYDATGDKIHIVFKDSTSVTLPWRNVGMFTVRYKEKQREATL